MPQQTTMETIIISDGQFGLQFDPPLEGDAITVAKSKLAQLASESAGYPIAPTLSTGGPNGQSFYVPRGAFAERVTDLIEHPFSTRFGACAVTVARALVMEASVDAPIAPSITFAQR